MNFWNLPSDGEMVYFESAYEVKRFFSYLGLNEDDLSDYGIIMVEPIEESTDKPCESIVYPVLSPMCVEEDFLRSTRGMDSRVSVDINNMELDSNVFPSFPCVMYLLMSDSYDRFGSVKQSVMHVEPLSTMKTLYHFEKHYHKNKELWDNRREEVQQYRECQG